MKLIEILSINLKYYRMQYNLSQEKFAEVLGTSLSYLNQIENLKVNVRLATVDKFADNLKKIWFKIENYIRRSSNIWRKEIN